MPALSTNVGLAGIHYVVHVCRIVSLYTLVHLLLWYLVHVSDIMPFSFFYLTTCVEGMFLTSMCVRMRLLDVFGHSSY